VIKEGEVIIVDEFTGRLMAGGVERRLHQAVEAKEKVKIQQENQTLAPSRSRTISACTPSCRA